MSKKKRRTVGQEVADLSQKTPEKISPIELAEAFIEGDKSQDDKGIIELLEDSVKKNISVFDGDFYIVIIVRSYRLLERTIKFDIIARQSCPSPQYDETVFRFDRASYSLVYLWNVPDKKTCEFFRENALHIAPEEKQLLQHVLDFYDGTLLRQAKKLNGECDDSPLLKEKKTLFKGV